MFLWIVLPCFLLFLIFLTFLYKKNSSLETFLLPPSYSSPPKRWGTYDLRCVPPPLGPKKHFAWNNSSYEYVYREKCLVMS
jgi:hypothetical protein